MRESTDVKLQVLDLETKSLKHVEPAISENLPKNVSLKLYELMIKVVESEVNPKTVQAACACATEIHRMLKLNLEIKKNNINKFAENV
jgi:hypothetical protein